MALAVVVVFISPINEMLDLAQQSDNLNCKGFVYNGNANHALSFNDTLDGGQSGSPLGCLMLKLYLPYILLVFLVYGLFAVIGNRVGNMFTGNQEAY
jgi:hypothetical protein